MLIINSPLLGITKIQNMLKPFDVEFGPLISEIDAKEKLIRECADSATMVRIKRKYIAGSRIEDYNPYQGESSSELTIRCCRKSRNYEGDTC